MTFIAHLAKFLLRESLCACFEPPLLHMSITLHVSLLSGHETSLSAEPETRVEELRRKVQLELDIGPCRLVAAGEVLQPRATLSEQKLTDGMQIVAVIRQPEIVSTRRSTSMALLTGDGSVLTWGDPERGGDCSAVHDQLVHVESLHAAPGAFAAILADGSLVTWGEDLADTKPVKHLLRNIRSVHSTGFAFGAIADDGSVVSWGHELFGGRAPPNLTNVRKLLGSLTTFAALRSDGSVVAWGEDGRHEMWEQLRNVRDIQATESAFVALSAGSVVAWGHPLYGGVLEERLQGLHKVQQIYATDGAFAAVMEDGSVVAWGDALSGGDVNVPEPVHEQLHDVQSIAASAAAFAALRADHTVVTWGCPELGGDSSAVRAQLRDVTQVCASAMSFAALRADGSVVAWGNAHFGGSCGAVQGQLRDVQHLGASANAFVALVADGSLIAWGDPVVVETAPARLSNNPCTLYRNRTAGAIERVVIVGGGPAGMTAAIYAARSNLCPLVIAPAIGGQLMAKGVDVENYPGLPRENGGEMIQVMKHQARSFYAEVWDDLVVSVNTSVSPFQIYTNNSGLVQAHTLIAATGANSKWLHVKGEWDYRGFGVSSCAACDGYLFKGKACAVIGGGDSAMEEALMLARICSSVKLIHRRDTFRASLVLQQRVLNHPHITAAWTGLTASDGEGDERKELTHLELADTQDSSVEWQLPVDAAFIAIGHDPNTRLFKGQVDMDESLGDRPCSSGLVQAAAKRMCTASLQTGYIHVNGPTKTSVPGFFAAGDVADNVYRQAITSAGSGAMAALDAERYLSENPVEEESCVRQEDFQSWSLKDLREQVKLLGVKCVACSEKADFIASLQASF
eukprot:s700_g4.t1